MHSLGVQTKNSVDATEFSGMLFGNHTLLILGFNLEIKTEFAGTRNLLLPIDEPSSTTGVLP